MSESQLDVLASANGLAIGGHVFNKKLPLECYQVILGMPNRTIPAGPPAPVGHRNNQIHLFDAEGIYLTEHHASRLIESVNFLFDPSDSPFPIERAFRGRLVVDGHHLVPSMKEAELDKNLFVSDFAGEYIVKCGNCAVCVSTRGRHDSWGKRRKPRFVVHVSVCF